MAQTLQELLAASNAKDAEIASLKAQLMAQPSIKIDAKISDYSKGTISITGINRFPVSLFPVQVDAVKTFMNSPDFTSFMASPDTQDKLRCAAVAHEWATKKGCEWPSDKKTADYDAKVTAYKAAYDTGYALAKGDKTLVASPRVKTVKTAVAR